MKKVNNDNNEYKFAEQEKGISLIIPVLLFEEKKDKRLKK